jgi:aminocarboxymuconate-semialdehyde decarboxylase
MPDVAVDAATGLQLVDFHNHFVGPDFALTTLAGLPPPARPMWEAINRQLADPDALLASIARAGVTARVISTPLEFVANAAGRVPRATIPRLNDAVAALVARHPGRLYGLATVDAYDGEVAGREVTRAVVQLGLRGVFVESAQGDRLPDAPQARPTFAAAAALGVPVFLHPVEDPALFARFKRFGRLGVRLTRGTINAAALGALLEGGVFDELPTLRVVVTALALGGVQLAGGWGDGARLRHDTPADRRRHVYIDTTGLHPALVRSAVDLVGADHVLMGTDWPVVVEDGARVAAVLTAAGLDEAARQRIAGDNTLALLGIA